MSKPRKPRTPPKPWRRADRNNDWYVTIRQKQWYVCGDGCTPEELQEAYAKVMLLARTACDNDFRPVATLFEWFLEHVHTSQSAETYRIRRKWLQRFLDHLKSGGMAEMQAADLKPFVLANWLNLHPAWGPSTRRLAMTGVTAALNWCVEQGHLEANPLQGKARLPEKRSRGREAYMEEKTYQEWLGFCRHECQRHMLMALWHTGCRPGEILTLGADPDTGFDAARTVWTVRGKRTKHSRTGLRTVCLTDTMIELSVKLRERHPTGAMFRTSRGLPWQPHNLITLFHRLRRKSAALHPERAERLNKLVPYGIRHTWATNRLREGHSALHVARQMGHQSTSTLHLHYDHVLAEEVRPVVEHFRAVDGEIV